jgi:hypothetical protein
MTLAFRRPSASYEREGDDYRALAQLRGYFTPNIIFSFPYNNNDLYTILPYIGDYKYILN